MPKLPVVKPDEAIKAFGVFGFELDRCNKHAVLRKPGHRYNLAIPLHGCKTIANGTLQRLIKTAGISTAEFIEALGKK